nr:hydantoinase B/oxoprolinase family protein [uncultured Sphingorhabdus sp.]
MTAKSWQFWVDRGGTFTDVIARSPEGIIETAKLLSENPEQYKDAAVAAIRQMTGVSSGPLPPLELRIGTTVATNALLEHKGEPTCLAITRGFGDALRIGYQERPKLFVRRIDLPEPLHHKVLEIEERVGADGDILTPLDEDSARRGLQAAFDEGLRSVAIVLMHGFRYPDHEHRLARIAAEIGFPQISVSHVVAPLIKLVGRGDTTLVDAYLSPVLRQYVQQLEADAGSGISALFMQSNGGLTSSNSFRGKDAILSGPAGGIVGMAKTAAQAGIQHVIGFDMGGTSTDVSHYAGRYERESETMVAGVRIRAPMMRIHTVAAGGGSICSFDGARFQVGPHSAGAIPGPACYRRGGPLTVTDCNVLLGKIVAGHFPKIFGHDGNQPLDTLIVRDKFEALAAEVASATGRRMTCEEIAEGYIAIAVANMANAIKKISVERGHDVTRYTLTCFGGAGGQHACLVADALGMDQIMIHPLAGVLSAYGMGLADRRAIRERTFGEAISSGALDGIVQQLADAAEADLRGQGIAGDVTSEAAVLIRYSGTDSSVEVAYDDVATMREAFETLHLRQFGFISEAPLIVELIRVEAVYHSQADINLRPIAASNSGAPVDHVSCYTAGASHNAPLYDRSELAAGFSMRGPAIIIDPVSTTVVEPGWQVHVDDIGNLLMTRSMPRTTVEASGVEVDPVRLEIMGGLFMAIAEEMGAALQHSASSVNIRERLDFSCAIFDAAGNLVANAPHMPVHLGSMGESVRTILKRRGGAIDGRGICVGDVYALNAPYDGGTHLPDITVVMPVFVAEGDASPAYFVAARGHHADIGGITPGSMPPNSQSVEEEGVLIDNMLIVEHGGFLDAQVRHLLGSGKWPSRNVDQNIADLKAQIAACAKGASELVRISDDYGRTVVSAYMDHVQDHAEEAVRRLILNLSGGHFRYAMDNGAVVEVSITIDREARAATVDFTGTTAQLSGNFNAPVSVVRAAVLYVVRTLIDDNIPMNEGCLKPVSIVTPEGTLVNPRYPAAVVAGNVETSQVITDALFGALGVMAGAQGTMNNFTFGNERYQYYETIAGGSGAGPDFDGTSVVQTHMTNSRLTDPEILETRFPVLLEEFAVRHGSGGKGLHTGGDGGVRRIRFLEPMTAGILSNRRKVPPFGLAGGDHGMRGVNRIERKDGRVEILGATATVDMAAGDVFVIETPGGGGYGKA